MAAAPSAPPDLHDVSRDTLAAATSGVEESSAGEFEAAGLPVEGERVGGVSTGGPRERRLPIESTYLASDNSLAARRALNAVTITVQLAPKAFPDWKSSCRSITPLLASVQGQIMAGNFKDGIGSCYVWLNVLNTSPIAAGQLCKLVLHELGHLGGLPHSPDKQDVMYSPFEAEPIPPICAERFALARK